MSFQPSTKPRTKKLTPCRINCKKGIIYYTRSVVSNNNNTTYLSFGVFSENAVYPHLDHTPKCFLENTCRHF